MEKLVRKVKLHVDVHFGAESDPAQLIAVSNLRLNTTEAPRLWLMLDTAPSLRTARKQEGMHRQAHAWAQSPESLRSVEMPAVVEDLWDAQQDRAEEAEWYLQVEMPGYGSYSYRVQPDFEASVVTFLVHEFLGDCADGGRHTVDTGPP
ncbi:MAG: hypothetical protein WD382_11100 [Halofilum sp. (in: g-proteobacteria)]